MCWFFGYLLIGFVLRWIGSRIERVSFSDTWQFDLLTIVFWPVSIVCGILWRS